MNQAMLKIHLLARDADKESLIQALKEWEVLHFDFEELNNNSDPAVQNLWQAYQKLNALDSTESRLASEYSALEIAQKTKTLSERQEELKFSIQQTRNSIDFWETWGSFDLEALASLERRGLKIRLYELNPEKELETDPEVDFFKMRDLEGKKLVVALCKSNHNIGLIEEPLSIPNESLPVLKNKLIQFQSDLEGVESELHELALKRKSLEQALLALQNQRQDAEALEGLKNLAGGRIKYLKAWLPKERETEITTYLKELPFAYRIETAEKGDEVPVKLQNSSYSRLFEPITKIFQLPHYFEYDLTPFIAVFYPILFAYCLGDAGYGALMTVLGLVLWFRLSAKERGMAGLVLILGLSTLVMGLIKSGSLFGIPLLPDSDHQFLRFLSQAVIIPDDSNYFFNAFNVALLIGVLQILIGIGIAIAKSWRFEGFKHSLAQWGKLLIVSSVIALFFEESLGLGEISLLALKASLFFGLFLVAFFHDLALKPLQRIGASVLPLFFIFTGLLGDVLSYVRLFALGVTSAVLGLVVNQIGMDMVSENWWSWLGAGAFLIFGHSLNLVLAVLGSFIHPLRLTFVEFYNNAQFEGGGKEYRPFKRIKSLNP